METDPEELPYVMEVLGTGKRPLNSFYQGIDVGDKVKFIISKEVNTGFFGNVVTTNYFGEDRIGYNSTANVTLLEKVKKE